MASLFRAVTTHPDADKPSAATQTHKQRLLILSSRGVTYRHRHLLNDLVCMLPHSRKDAKLDSKNNLSLLNEVAELYNCNGVLFFEARKRQDLYMWLSRVPNGPCVKFHVQNLHTMSELNFTGNALKGSRAICSFDAAFDAAPATALIREMLLQTFAVPRGARKSKPFIDRVVAFTWADGKVWVRHYQITTSAAVAPAAADAKKDDGEKEKKKDKKSKAAAEAEKTELVEIGPRFVMTPIVILEGSFGGPVVYENREFVSPNAVRTAIREKRAVRKGGREEQRTKRGVKKRQLQEEMKVVKEGEVEDAVLFA
ncbi:Brix domain-containing protein [Geopyxis carbonaria]|nr:Brix domain-containing protein [Geopyxis carbonaria]